MADALDTMRKAMALHETIATTEQKRGDEADLKLMAASMSEAARLAIDIAAIEDRRGITDAAQVPTEMTVNITRVIEVCPGCGFRRAYGGKTFTETLEAVQERARAKAKGQKTLLALPALATAAAAPAHDAPLPVGPASRTESVHDEGSYATERGNGTRGPGSVMW
jgi:hypothetical protein